MRAEHEGGARRFRLLTAREIDALVQRAGQAVRAWESDWSGPGALAVACRAAGSERADRAQPWQQHGGAQDGLWLARGAGLHDALALALFGVAPDAAAQARSRMVEAVTGEALDDLLARLAGAVGMAAFPAEGALDLAALELQFRPGSGAAVVVLALAGASLRLLLPCQRVVAQPAAARTAATPLCGVRGALAGQQVRVAVQVGTAELTIGHLRTLRVGDVIPLGTGLNEAVPVIAAGGGAALCHAHLGRVGDAIAIELTK